MITVREVRHTRTPVTSVSNFEWVGLDLRCSQPLRRLRRRCTQRPCSLADDEGSIIFIHAHDQTRCRWHVWRGQDQSPQPGPLLKLCKRCSRSTEFGFRRLRISSNQYDCWVTARLVYLWPIHDGVQSNHRSGLYHEDCCALCQTRGEGDVADMGECLYSLFSSLVVLLSSSTASSTTLVFEHDGRGYVRAFH